MPTHERHRYRRCTINLLTPLILISFLYFLTYAYCSSAPSININDESSDGINNEEVSDIITNIIDEEDRRRILATIITDYQAIESEDDDDDIAESEREEELDSGGLIKISPHHYQPLAQYYFSNEIDFIAKQAMVLGDFHPTSKEGETNTNTNQDEDDIERLRFIEKSLRLELDYIRRLKDMLKNPDEILDNRTTAESSSSSSTSKTPNERGTSEIILHTINDATWPTWASYATNFTHDSTIQTDDGGDDDDDAFDYDDAAERGFGNMHEDFNCYEHSKNQNKPIYTEENWKVIWDAFVESTLFPFPRPEESVRIYYTDLAPGKGRGNFAWFDIPKGILLHEGHPNTVFFLDNSSFYRFIALLPRAHQCDVLEWVWIQDLTDTGNKVLCLNMDEGVFTNGGGDEWGGTINIEMKESTSLNFYASRDIEKGEELLYDYDSMEFDTYDMGL